MFTINQEKIPAPTSGRGRAGIYPFADMQVGDSFDAPRDMGFNAKSGQDKRGRSVAASAYRWAKKHNPAAKFTISVVDENIVRCWRVA